MLSLLGWAFAAFWAARGLLYGLPALLLDPDASIGISPLGVTTMGAAPHPWLGIAFILAAGVLLRDKGPLLWMAAGLALAERLGGPRGVHLEWSHAAGAGLFAVGVWCSRYGVIPLLVAVLLPQIVLREFLRFRPGWQQPAILLGAGLVLVLAIAYRRPRNWAPAWRWWPGAGVSALLLVASLWGNQFVVARAAEEKRRAIAALPRPDPATPFPMDFFHKGVSFTAEGLPYDSPRARSMLTKLPEYAVDAVALIPYGFSPRGEPRIRIAGRSESWENEDGMELLAAEAHRLGMRVMLKPHVWRLQGRAPIPDGEARQWLAEYRLFVIHYAQFAARIHADIFCIGTELRGLTPHDAEWREMIAAVRKEYRGPIVYAANHGEEFETIRFWDALDYIGIDNYYPLDDRYSAATLVGKIEAVQARFQKPVLFTEAGFGAHQNSHREPWEDESTKPLDLAEQARSYEALLRAVYTKPWFRGVYWWKIGTNGYGGAENNSMSPWRKPAMDVVKRFYLLH